MTKASQTAHDLLLRHATTPDGQLPLPVALGRALEPDGAEFGWPGDFAYALLMPAEIIRVMFVSDLDMPEMARKFGVPWCQVRRHLAMLGLDDYCE